MKTKQAPIKNNEDTLEEALVTKQTVKIKDLESSLARALADYANLERRYSEQSSSVIKFANSTLLAKLLDVRDHLAMASQVLKDQSINMILGSLDKIFIDEGVTEVKTDGLYDPSTMECQEQVEGEKDKVVKVIRNGYLLNGRVLRTARVVVGNGMSKGEEPKKNN